MPDQSPLAQAEARILALEADVERLEREKECLAWNHAQAETLVADLREERDALRAALAPILRHAERDPANAGVLRFSVEQAKRIKEEVDHA